MGGLSPLLWALVLALLVHTTTGTYLNRWAVKVDGGPDTARGFARKHGLVYQGQIGSLEGYYLFSHPRVAKRSTRPSSVHTHWKTDPKVLWIEQQKARVRVKRDFLHFNDPKWPEQWYMNKKPPVVSDMGVPAAWKMGYTGKGVVITILDDGVERTHPDLKGNYDPDASYDVNGGDSDPTPRYEASNFNRHGTRCAGEVAATANNSVCVVGIAYNSRIGGIRMLDGDITDEVEARSLSHKPQHIDIYSSSWGPDDSGKVVDGPRPLTKTAIEKGIKEGRGGKGSIFVWANGNGGRNADSCACDGYTNSIYTLSIAATSETGTRPWYLEECASTLASTYSSANAGHRMIVSTDLHGKCTTEHTGTSAAAPLAAGIFALALEANPSQLTWRDLQHIVMMTSRTEAFRDAEWIVNGMGRQVSHRYGYGMLDAAAIVTKAKNWTSVPEQHICRNQHVPTNKRLSHTSAVLSVRSNGCCETYQSYVLHVEHVVLKVSLRYKRRGDLQINLISPMGTNSTILPQRSGDTSYGGFKGWEFMSTHFWGEDPSGTWTIAFHNKGAADNSGVLESAHLIFYGTSTCPYGCTGKDNIPLASSSGTATTSSYGSSTSSQGSRKTNRSAWCVPIMPAAITPQPDPNAETVALVLKIVVPIFVSSVILAAFLIVGFVFFRKRLKTTSKSSTRAIPGWPSEDLSRQSNPSNGDPSVTSPCPDPMIKSIPRAKCTKTQAQYVTRQSSQEGKMIFPQSTMVFPTHANSNITNYERNNGSQTIINTPNGEVTNRDNNKAFQKPNVTSANGNVKNHNGKKGSPKSSMASPNRNAKNLDDSPNSVRHSMSYAVLKTKDQAPQMSRQSSYETSTSPSHSSLNLSSSADCLPTTSLRPSYRRQISSESIKHSNGIVPKVGVQPVLEHDSSHFKNNSSRRTNIGITRPTEQGITHISSLPRLNIDDTNSSSMQSRREDRSVILKDVNNARRLSR